MTISCYLGNGKDISGRTAKAASPPILQGQIIAHTKHKNVSQIDHIEV
jgi:hypothetical protein